MANKITSIQNRPLNYATAMDRIRLLHADGAVIFTPECDRKCVMLGFSDGDFQNVIRHGQVIGDRQASDCWAYNVDGFSVDNEKLGYWIQISGRLLVVELVSARTITEE